jgi:hypothetical protein
MAKGLVKLGKPALKKKAALSFEYSMPKLDKCVADAKYVGVLRLLYSEELWAGVVSISSGADLRSNALCKPLWELLRLNYEYLPVGNAYCEYQVKLIKNTRSQDTVNASTMSRKLRARTVSHMWRMNSSDFADSRKALGHNMAQPRKDPAASKPDFTDLATAMKGSKRKAKVLYVVNKIHEVRGKGKSVEYLVEWKGSRTNTWEPAHHLEGCEDELERFKKASTNRK